MKEKSGGIAVRLHFLLAATLLFMVMCFTSSALADDQPPGTGTVDDPYQIGTLDELYWFVDYVNASKLTDEEKLNAHNAVLTADIVVNNGVMSEDSIRAVEWVPINNYNAIFDGQGHTISGISYKSSATEIGVFARMDTSSAVIKNLGVINSYINGTGHYIGGICGISYGTIENCYYKGTVAGNSTNATNSTVNSVNYCDVFIGGICGRTGGQIINCYNEAEIKATNPSSNSGGVRVFVGGIAGASNSDSVISMCNNKGSVKEDLNVSTYDVISETGGITGTSYGTIEKCYNTGYVNSSVINQISSTYSKRSNYNWV